VTIDSEAENISNTSDSLFVRRANGDIQPSHVSRTTLNRPILSRSITNGVSLGALEPFNSTTSPQTSSASLSQLQQLFNIPVSSVGTQLLIGSPSSGVNDYTAQLKSAFVLRGGQFATNETYNSIVGAAAGYIGSDASSSFMKYLAANPKGTVVIDGIENAGETQLSDFISMVRQKSFIDKSGKILEPIDVSKLKFYFVLHEKLESELELTSDEICDRLLKLRKADRSALVPSDLLDIAQPIHFYDFLDRLPQLASKFAEAFSAPTPTRLTEAVKEFYLTNSEIFEIAAHPVRLSHTENRKILLLDDQEYRSSRILSKDDFFSFLDNLASYHGQEDAVTEFQSALALKVQKHYARPTSLFCVGPPGIGKTEIAKRLGAAIGKFVRIDGNVIQNSADLFGSTAAPGKLATALTKGEPAVILFDEAEKMSRETVLSLLQLLDEGLLNDQFLKETWALQETLVVFTSNAIKDPNIQAPEARRQLSELFPQEFVDRLDFIVPFRYFSAEHKRGIAQSIADGYAMTLSSDELETVIQADSIRQIQLDIQRIDSLRAANSLRSEHASRHSTR
jgi:SpoVK/Ycf46/Vps4 family AAA+-type ATPase